MLLRVLMQSDNFLGTVRPLGSQPGHLFFKNGVWVSLQSEF